MIFIQITSQGVSSTVVQNESQEAQLQAAKADKFASSLRETSAAAVAQQRESTREMAVIEQHQRKQSAQQMQQQQQQQYRQQQQQYTQQSYAQQNRAHAQQSSIMASDYMYGGGQSSTAANANYQRWSNSAHSETRRESQMTSSKTAWAASASAQEQQIRAAAFQQQRAQAAVQQQKLSTSIGSSSSQHKQSNTSFEQQKQSVVSQETRASSAGRRRTWAESTHFHGEGLVIGARDSFTIGQGTHLASSRRQSGMASEYHEVSCPASGLAKSRSAFKYDRQSGSGHKLFLPTVSN